jgi:hypothetical protein
MPSANDPSARDPSANDIDRVDTPRIDGSDDNQDINKDIAWQEFSGARRAERKRWGLYLGAGAAVAGALIGGVSVFAVVAALRDDTAARNRVAAKNVQPPGIESTARSEASSPLAESPVGRVQPCSYQDWLDQKCRNRNAAGPQRSGDSATTTAVPAGVPATAAAPAATEAPVQAPVVTQIAPAPAEPAAPVSSPVQTQASAPAAAPQAAAPDPAKPSLQKTEPARIETTQPAQPAVTTAAAPPIQPSAKAVDAKKKKQAMRPRDDQPASTDGSAAPAAAPLPREGRTIEATVVEEPEQPAETRRGLFSTIFGSDRRDEVVVREPAPERAAPTTQRSRAATRDEVAPKGKKKAARSRVQEVEADDDEDAAAPAPRQGRGSVRVVIEEEAPAPVERRSPFDFFR